MTTPSLNVIYHYTSIDTLELILKNRTLRFNRLDQVADLSESSSFNELKLGKYLFVNCWTDCLTEKIPLWHMHASDMKGVRIQAIKQLLFEPKLLIVPDEYKSEFKQTGGIKSLLSFEEMFTDDYFILPMFMQKMFFERKVIYDNNYKQLKNEAIEINTKQIGNTVEYKAKINDPTRIAALKSPDYSFEEELRYVLMILPSLQLPNRGQFSKYAQDLATHISYCLYKNIEPTIKYIDINVNPFFIDNIDITIGPKCSENDFKRVEQLINRYSSNGKIHKSKFEGTIKK